MRKGWMIAIIALLLLIVGIIVGIYVFKINQTQDSNMLDDKQLAKQQKEETQINNVIATSVTEEKTSPNATIIKKQYFKGCNVIEDIENIFFFFFFGASNSHRHVDICGCLSI